MSESIQINNEDMPSLLYNTLPNVIIDELKNAKKIRKYNSELAGCLENENLLSIENSPLFKKHILEIAYYFLETCKQNFVIKELYSALRSAPKLNLNELWINEQKSGEYNPLHIHGGLFSFVVYLQIPYTMSEQTKIDKNLNSEKVLNGATQFFDPYNHFDRKIIVDKSSEGLMVLFPAWVLHTVYPYKGKYKNPRVTISGNINLYT